MIWVNLAHLWNLELKILKIETCYHSDWGGAIKGISNVGNIPVNSALNIAVSLCGKRE